MRLENATDYPANFTLALDKAGHEQIILVTKVTVQLTAEPGTACLLAPEQRPLFDADLFGPDPATDATLFENDFAAFKPQCDVLCHARAHAPGGQPVTELGVGIRVGGWSKRFTALGSRIWLKAATGYQPSGKRPFVVQDISYDQAYGGTDPDPSDPAKAATFQTNPVGLGFYPLRADREGAALAQTAAMGSDPVDPSGDFAPMAFGPLGRSWLPRRLYAGTYDDPWMEYRLPFLPLDFDDRYFQAAAPDQQIAYPIGGEPVEAVNLSPEGRLAGEIPRLQIVVLFERKNGRVTQRIANLDTVLLVPEERAMCLTYRTRITAERDLFEFARAVISERLLDGARHHQGGGTHG
jgi:hypothetical protein